MLAIGCRDGELVEENAPVPVPGRGEVLIKVAAAGVNRPDILQRQGHYPLPEGASPILGLEVAGTVEAVGGGVTRWKVGDRVCALLAGGGYAEYAVAPEGQCLALPEGLTLTQAAALPEAVFTVWANLFEAGGLQPGATVLIHGGAGGVGSFAIQMAKAQGTRVFTTAGSADKATFCRSLGADRAINYREEDFVEVIRRDTAGRGVDVVLDIVGGDYVPRNLGLLAPEGRHVSIAFPQGRHVPIDLLHLMQKRLTLTGSTLRPRPVAEKARLARVIEERVWPWVASGKVNPVLNRTIPLKDAAEAHKIMETGESQGKIVLETTGPLHQSLTTESTQHTRCKVVKPNYS